MGSVMRWIFGITDDDVVSQGAPTTGTPQEELLGLCVVINLDTARSRYEAFLRSFRDTDLKDTGLSRYSAVKGSDLDIASMVTPLALQEINDGTANGYRRNHYELTIPAVGCYMSHLGVWTRLLNSPRDHVFVFEDDASLPRDLGSKMSEIMKVVPDDWDIVLLGYVLTKFNVGVYYHRVRRFYCLHAYLISQRGVRKIMATNQLYPIAKQIDTVLSDMTDMGLLNVYASPSPIVRQNNTLFPTSVQSPVKLETNRMKRIG